VFFITATINSITTATTDAITISTNSTGINTTNFTTAVAESQNVTWFLRQKLTGS